MDFPTLRRDFKNRQLRANRAQERQLRLTERLDLMLLIVVSLAILVLVAGASVVAYLQRAHGFLEEPPFQPIVDERLAANLRAPQSLARGPFVGAALPGGGPALYVLRAGGLMHRLDTRSGLWSDSEVSGGAGMPTRVSGLSAACPHQDTTLARGCPDSTAMFAYSRDGGLVLGGSGTGPKISGRSFLRKGSSSASSSGPGGPSAWKSLLGK